MIPAPALVAAMPAKPSTRRALKLAIRIGMLTVGATIVGCCVAVMLWNDIGPGPLDVLINAVKTQTGLPLAFTVWLTIGALTALAWMLGRRPGPGTILGPFVVGPVTQSALAYLNHWDPPSSLVARVAIHLAAVAVVGLGAGAAICSGLGAGTGELLSAAASERSGRPVLGVRIAMELSFIAVGGLLGGPVGLGTVVVALCIGPSVARGCRVVNAGIASTRRQMAEAMLGHEIDPYAVSNLPEPCGVSS